MRRADLALCSLQAHHRLLMSLPSTSRPEPTGGSASPAALAPDETNPASEAQDPIDLVSDTSESTDDHSDSDDSSAAVVVEPIDQGGHGPLQSSHGGLSSSGGLAARPGVADARELYQPELAELPVSLRQPQDLLPPSC